MNNNQLRTLTTLWYIMHTGAIYFRVWKTQPKRFRIWLSRFKSYETFAWESAYCTEQCIVVRVWDLQLIAKDKHWAVLYRSTQVSVKTFLSQTLHWPFSNVFFICLYLYCYIFFAITICRPYFLAAKSYERHGELLKILWDCLFSGGEGGDLDYHKGAVGTLSG